jgi:hypothetical protein
MYRTTLSWLLEASRPCRFPPEERGSGIHSIGGWVDPRAYLDDVEKRKFLTRPGLELRPVTNRYADCAVPAPDYVCKEYKL